MNLEHIRTFNAVAEHGSLLAASRHLGMTQPTVGRHMDLLEERLGMSLFVRGREGMRLTERGRDLVATAREMVATAADFERIASGFEERVEGTVRIAANQIFGALLLPRLIAGFMAEHPMIQIELDVSNATANLLQRDADVALRLFRPRQNDLVARKVGELPMGLYAHQSYLDRRPAPGSLADLTDHVLVGLDRGLSLVAGFRDARLELAPGDFAFRCDNDIAGIHAVRAGIGIGPLHVGMAEGWPDVVRVLPGFPIPSFELWLACHADVRNNKRIRLVMDYLGARLADPYSR